MARVSSFNFGFIVVDGKQYVYDVLILPDGTVKEREPGKGRLGSHSIRGSEIENLVQAQPDVIVVGTGTSGMARLDEDAAAYLPKLKLQVMPSTQAVARFNQLADERKRVAALIHVTC